MRRVKFKRRKELVGCNFERLACNMNKKATALYYPSNPGWFVVGSTVPRMVRGEEVKYSDAQIKVLAEVYRSEGDKGVLLTGFHRRSVEILARDRLVTYVFVPSPSRRRSNDSLIVRKAKSPRICDKAMKLIKG